MSTAAQISEVHKSESDYRLKPHLTREPKHDDESRLTVKIAELLPVDVLMALKRFVQ